MNRRAEEIWIHEHFEELVNNYGGKYIAILNHEVIAVASTYEEAQKAAQTKQPGSKPFVYLVPSLDDLNYLLRKLHLLGLWHLF